MKQVLNGLGGINRSEDQFASLEMNTKLYQEITTTLGWSRLEKVCNDVYGLPAFQEFSI
jgi:hypothetical protein